MLGFLKSHCYCWITQLEIYDLISEFEQLIYEFSLSFFVFMEYAGQSMVSWAFERLLLGL